MNVTDFTYLINKPYAINEKQTNDLGDMLDEFPYFQSARALRLKGLYNQNSFRYNYALKVTAAHTTCRTVLFDFITSNSFVAIEKEGYTKKEEKFIDVNTIDTEIIAPKVQFVPKENKLEQSILATLKETSVFETKVAAKTETPAEKIEVAVENLEITEESAETSVEKIEVAVENLEIAEENLGIGKPLDFSRNEKHSFQEWLQLSKTKPIVREKENEALAKTHLSDEEKKKKAELIDKFIETSPKISPMKQGEKAIINFEINKTPDNSYLMTETLARVYLEQKKYQKAIQAYEILILKYPEKSSFFAHRITDIKFLQQNNN